MPDHSCPVCGQKVDPLRARAVAIAPQGGRLYFCSKEHHDQHLAATTGAPAKAAPAAMPTPAPVAATPVIAPRRTPVEIGRAHV
jgi:YHS domain-containing protein